MFTRNQYKKITLHLDCLDLHWAAKSGNIKAVKALLAKGENVNVRDIDGATPLHLAVKSGNIEVVNALLAQGANIVNAARRNGATPLHLAAKSGNTKAVKALLAEDANVNVREYIDGATPLHLAAKNDHVDAVNALIKAGADIDARNQYERTPLHSASLSSNVDSVNALIKAGADINAIGKDGNTPLHLATYLNWNDLDTIKALLLAGADTSLNNHDGKTPIDLRNDDDIKQFIRKATAELRVMKKTKIGNSTISFYQFLTERDENKLAGYLNNEEIRKALKIGSHKNDSFHDSDFTKDQNSGLVKGQIGKGLETINYESDFPHYSDRIKNQIKKATQRRIALSNVDQKIKISTIDNKETLAPYLIDEVIKYLSNEDLDNLKEAGKAKNVCTATEGAEQKFAEIVKKVRIDQDTNISSGLEDIDVSQASAGIDK